ncbi:MAG: hypothetical protein NXI10_04490 [bacterium]|nr:hypothetical protein [bacterium]
MHHLKKKLSIARLSIILTVILGGIAFFPSCTIQKRVHRKGWFVQWNFNQRDKNKSGADALVPANKTNTSTDFKSSEQLSSEAKNSNPDKKLVFDAGSESVSNKNNIKTEEIVSEKGAPLDTETKNSMSSKNDESNSTGRVYRKWHFAVPFSFAGIGIIAFIAIMLFSGLIPLLIPIGLTILTALLTLIIIYEDKKKNDAPAPGRQLLFMTMLIGAIWIVAIFLLFTSVSPIYPIAILGFLFFGFAVAIANKQNQKRRNDVKTSELEDEQSSSVDLENASASEEENLEEQTRITVYKPPLTISQAFPGITAAGIALIIIGLLIGFIMFLITAFVGLFGGIISGPIVYLVLIPIAMVISGIVLLIRRNQLYKVYLQDYREGPTTNSETNRKESEHKNQNAGALLLMIFLLILVVAVTLLLLL